jgi:hypothetical protein
MRRTLALCGAMAALFICGPAMAQSVPVLSGKYATTYNEICQAGTDAANYSTGATYNQILVAAFNSATNTVTLTGSSVYGPLVVNGARAKLAQATVNKSYPYSNTATTITIGKDTFNALYGPLILGQPQWAVFGGISSGGCSASAVAIRQSAVSVPLPGR